MPSAGRRFRARRLATLGLLLLAGTTRGDDPIEREWWVRAVALAPEAHASEVLQTLSETNWRRRAQALDALTRAAAGEGGLADDLLEAARGALADAHPGVRTHAVAALGAARAPIPGAAQLAREPLAHLRLALAQALEFAPSPGRASLLAELAVDADERVRVAARNALAGQEADEEGAKEACLVLLEHVAAEEDTISLASLLSRLVHGHVDEGWFAVARERGRAWDPGRRALLEALAFAREGRGDARVLVAGASSSDLWEPGPAGLLALAGRARSRELAQTLRRRLEEGPLEDAVRRGFLGLFLASLEPRALSGLREEAPGAELLAECLAELGMRLDVWDERTCAPWMEADAPPGVRRALLVALSDAYTRGRDEGCAALLIRFLPDANPDLARRAFEVLCEARTHSSAVEEALFAAYAGLDDDARLARLGWFSREQPLPSFRDEWIRIGNAYEQRRAAVCELLAGFEGDEVVEGVLRAWVRGELEALVPEAPAEGGPIPRDTEQRIQAELRALARVSEGAAREDFASALRATLGRSHEIGKVAAAALGRSAGGRLALSAMLEGGELANLADRRTRIEACIALAREGEPPARETACRLLFEDREGATWDLRGRMLDALASSDVAAALEALLGIVLEPETEPVERIAIVSRLADRRDEKTRATLRALVGGKGDLESRFVALRALAGGGDAEGVRALFASCLSGPLGEGDEESVLRGEFLIALAALPVPPEGFCEEWLRAPLARAEEDLAQRFVGHELAAISFTWGSELSAARMLARRGNAAPCLTRLEHWERLDGRLLLALGEAHASAGDLVSADRLLAGAVHALAGERDPDRTLLAWGRALRLGVVWQRERWTSAAALAQQTLSARRAGFLSETRWTGLFGGWDPEAGIDPDGRVRAVLWQARARAALEVGDREGACAAASRAASACGFSRLAKEAQQELERALTPR